MNRIDFIDRWLPVWAATAFVALALGRLSREQYADAALDLAFACGLAAIAIGRRA